MLPRMRAGWRLRQARKRRVKARTESGSASWAVDGERPMARDRPAATARPPPGEAGMDRVSSPRHRRARAVAAAVARPEGIPLGIDQPLERHVRLRQTQFLALVKEHRAAQAAEQRDQHLRERRIAFFDTGDGRPAGRRAHDVVVGERPCRPSGGRTRQHRLQGVTHHRRSKIIAHQHEAVGGVVAVGPSVYSTIVASGSSEDASSATAMRSG